MDLWPDPLPTPAPDAIRLDVVADDELGVIVRAVAPDGREATAADGPA
jgi:hypothetical protein